MHRLAWAVTAGLLALAGCDEDPGPRPGDGATDVPLTDLTRGDGDAAAPTDGGPLPDGADCSDPTLPADAPGDPASSGVTFATSPRTHATLHSVSLEWDLTGDDDHDATCTVKFRRAKSCAWRDALPLFRADYAWFWDTDKASAPANLFAGSLLFLTPGTEYQIWLQLSDPDGGAAQRLLTVKTRPIPTPPQGGRTLHVEPGSGGGDGSATSPYKGIAAADAAAKPGDTLLLHKGHYAGTSSLTTGGGAGGQYVVWKAAGDGAAVFDELRPEADHLWIEDLDLQQASGQSTNGLKDSSQGSTDLVVVGNRFTGFHYSIMLTAGSADWYIADNDIVGDNDPTTSDFSGEGIELNHSAGHVVSYNRITRTADGVSYALRDCDIYGNDIFETSDDGLEPDYGFANIRMWGNRLANTHNNAISLQPQKLGPWYVIRNQVIGAAESVFKFRTQDRLVVVNNTFVNWGTVVRDAQYMMFATSRNNLFISADGQTPWKSSNSYQSSPQYYNPPIWTPDYRTDVDHDGFDWGSAAAFSWNGKSYADVAAFSAAAQVEAHGLQVDRTKIFASYDLPASYATIGAKVLELSAGCNAEDAGATVPGIVDTRITGSAPDLGAYERGQPLPHYGPRDAQAMTQHASYWALY